MRIVWSVFFLYNLFLKNICRQKSKSGLQMFSEIIYENILLIYYLYYSVNNVMEGPLNSILLFLQI
jgi:hypothetical protein